MCKKSGEHLRHCAINVIDVPVVTKNAIKVGEPQLCFQEYNQEKRDECYYDFVKFYYYDTNLYEDLDCYGEFYDYNRVGVTCFFSADIGEIEKRKERTRKVFIQLCGNIKNGNLRDECYKFKK